VVTTLSGAEPPGNVLSKVAVTRSKPSARELPSSRAKLSYDRRIVSTAFGPKPAHAALAGPPARCEAEAVAQRLAAVQTVELAL
jgi:hypothetical protein